MAAEPAPLRTTGREGTYALSLDEAWPCLVYSEDPGGATVPERLIRAHRKAREALEKAELEIARWVKYTAPDVARRDLGPLLKRLDDAGA